MSDSLNNRRAQQVAVLVLAALLLGGMLGALWQIRVAVLSTYQDSREQIAGLFAADILGDPGEFDFSFSEVERASNLALNLPFVEGFLVFKAWPQDARGDWRMIYPYWAADPFIDPATQRNDLTLIAINNLEDEQVGQVFVEFDRQPARLTTALIWGGGATAALILGILLLRLFRQERELEHTLIRLDEKQRELILTERLALAGRLAASLLHDLRKPVNAIGALVEDAVDEAPLDQQFVEEQVQLFRKMLRGSGIERFASSAGRGRSDEKEWVDVADMVNRSLALVEHEGTGINISPVPYDKPVLFFARPYEVMQVLSNLILNAFQILKNNGTVLVSWRQAGHEIQISVEDSGPGISPEQQAGVFEPFATGRADEGGTGLGLYIVREIVRSWGGGIVAGSSEELGGARFSISIPVSDRPRQEQVKA